MRWEFSRKRSLICHSLTWHDFGLGFETYWGDSAFSLHITLGFYRFFVGLYRAHLEPTLPNRAQTVLGRLYRRINQIMDVR